MATTLREPEPVPATIADGLPHSLDPASIRAEALTWWVLVLMIFAAGVVAMVILFLVRGVQLEFALVSGGWLLALIAASLGALCWPRLSWNHTRYLVHERGIEIRQGVVWRRVISVPKSRVQHTDVIQGPLMRRYGLAALTIHTAGTEHAVVVLPGLPRPTALRIRDFLIGEWGRDGV